MRCALTSDLVLAVETSCDDTTAAVVAGGRRVLSSQVASQEQIHALFGGVVPEVASRKHVEAITHVVQGALDEAGATWDDLGGLAVTNGPGLIGSLLVGVSAMKAYHLATGLPLVGVNHIEAHVNSNFCDLSGRLIAGPSQGAPEEFPAVCLIASGGHSDLVRLRSRREYELLGCTRDDAAGEALDKAARVLGLGYPGGPALERAAAQGAARFDLPRPQVEGSLDYSFAGLKTALVRLAAELKQQGELPVHDLAASYQEAVVDTLVRNVRQAALTSGGEGIRQILLCGGVAANTLLRERLSQLGEELGIPVRYPPLQLCTDNAAMVGAAGWLKLTAGEHDNLALDVFSAMP
jgi:N6-L-threonylcarbamoyladenine synthase